MAARKKSTKKTATATARPAAAKREKTTDPKPNRTFAVRITDQELEAIHTAAGPRNAARFARAALAAFASSDTKAFGRVLDEAAKARG